MRIAGRLKEVITHAGQPIYPIEMEEVLFSHLKVANAQELRQFCRERLADSHVPAYIKFVREFPLTAVGKVQKFKISQAYAKELGLA